MTNPIRVTCWHEYRHEKKVEAVRKIYPDGMHTVIKAGIEKFLGNQVQVRTATLDQDANHGLSDDVLNNTDVLTWWGHVAHNEVRDDIARKVHQRVLHGMGLIVLHSAHFSKIFKTLMGTNCHLKWRESGEKERIWNVSPGHPITLGMKADYFELAHEEMYGEHFDIPQPEELVFISWFPGGEVFRSGCIFNRGAGKIFYFRPGHETFPTYHNEDVQRVIANAVKYLAPTPGTVAYRDTTPSVPPMK